MKGFILTALSGAAMMIVGVSPSLAQDEGGLDDAGSIYVVDEGDTLREIARRFYLDGSAFPTIIIGNNAMAAVDQSFQVIEDEQDIEVGQRVWIPATARFTEGDESGPEVVSSIHWGYQGMGGPGYWGSLESHYSPCGSGLRQSPIDIPKDTLATKRKLVFDYLPSELNVVHNGHTVQVNYEDGSTLNLDGEVYELAQFHFHVPSEHHMGSVPASMEMHLVHIAADGKLAVIGILFDVGDEDNPFLEKIWQALPPEGYVLNTNQQVSAADAFHEEGPMYHYSGSLTTPPCSEIVEWFVVQRRELMSRNQLAEIVERMGLNARPVQAINDRSFK